MGVLTNGEYNITKGLCFSLPVKYLGDFRYEIIKNL